MLQSWSKSPKSATKVHFQISRYPLQYCSYRWNFFPLVTFGNRLSFLKTRAGKREQLQVSYLFSRSCSLSLPAFPPEKNKNHKKLKSNTQAFMGVRTCVCMHVKERDGERIPAPEVIKSKGG